MVQYFMVQWGVDRRRGNAWARYPCNNAWVQPPARRVCYGSEESKKVMVNQSHNQKGYGSPARLGEDGGGGRAAGQVMLQ